ncbi:hypothetical protein [Gemmatimonas sp.]|uniref:hypothetical protein n=1 Tax=Gemmatimonas sp. TaxID=1962908 RepID=UPI0025C4C491|nr:hypothetical protein [Gemmatimonas sp.]MCA2991178.1 hypothetical protein [Gemmatimonas sp.]
MSDEQTASEPVAWAVMINGDTPITFAATREGVAFWEQNTSNAITPLYAHPSAAAVRVTDAMVEAACRVLDSPDSAWSFRRAMRQALTAALTAASEVQP